MNWLRRFLVAPRVTIALVLAASSAVAAGQQQVDHGALLDRVQREGDEVPRALRRQLAAPADARTLADLIEAVDALRKPITLQAAYAAVAAFAGDPALAADAVEFLAAEADRRSPGNDRQAVGELVGLMPHARHGLTEILRESSHAAHRAPALGGLLTVLGARPTKEGLECLLDSFQ